MLLWMVESMMVEKERSITVHVVKGLSYLETLHSIIVSVIKSLA